MKLFNIYEAKTNLSKLLELVAQGEQVVIARNGKPIADLTAHQPHSQVVFGTAKGQFKWDPETFDAIDPQIQEMFYANGRDKN